MNKKRIKTKKKTKIFINIIFATTFEECSPEIIPLNFTRDKAIFVPTIVTSDRIIDFGCSAHMTTRKDLHSLDTHQGVVTMNRDSDGDTIMSGTIMLLASILTKFNQLETRRVKFEQHLNRPTGNANSKPQAPWRPKVEYVKLM